jgi:hypothetical protein
MSFAIKHTDFKSLQFEELIPIEFNQVDIDRMISSIIELTVRQGRTMVSKTKPEEYPRYLDSALRHPQIEGLENAKRRRVLDGWLRSSIIKMGTKGEGRKGEAMDFIRPITVGVYRSGLPRLRARNRKADVLVYKSILAEGIRRGSQTGEIAGISKGIADLVRSTLGQGINTGISIIDLPAYDEVSNIDISALLTMRFLEGFEQQDRLGNTDVAARSLKEILGAVPGAMAPIGQDIFSLLTCYGKVLSAPELTEHMTALISLRLFQYPLRVALASANLIETGEISDEMRHPININPLSIYCDFTRNEKSASYELSKNSVQRDLEALRRFFGDRLLLRSMNSALDKQNFRREHPTIEGMAFQDRLKYAVQNKECREMQWVLNDQIDSIQESLLQDETGRDGVDLITQLREAKLPEHQTIRMVLVEGLRRRGLEMQILWFWSTGGIAKNYGILKGSLKARSNWRYSPSDQLLTSLLLSCFVSDDGVSTVEELEMQELLTRIRNRFGIYITELPTADTSAVANSACSENREAFVAKLQLLGCFESLSDDFSAQMVRRPRKASQ